MLPLIAPKFFAAIASIFKPLYDFCHSCFTTRVQVHEFYYSPFRILVVSLILHEGVNTILSINNES